MTREILFRGYCPDEKRWVYGYYLKHRGCPEDGVEGCEAIGVPQKDLWFDWKEIDPLTLCEYSGFNDRYGNPLYHGDKVRMLDALDGSKGKDAVVKYDEARGEWVLEVFRNAERLVKDKYALGGSFIHARCVKAYDVLKERTIYDDYIKKNWGVQGMNRKNWRLCFVRNGVCVFAEYLHLADGIDWTGEPARNADWPIPMVCCHLKYLRFVAEKVNTDVFGKDSPFSEWNQRHVVLKGLPAIEVNGDVVKYGDEDRTVIGIFKRHKIPCGWRE